jgi:hypothetical protein
MDRDSRAEEVRRVIKIDTRLSDGHLREISCAPKHLWKNLVLAAERDRWTREELAGIIERLVYPPG